jgi:purine-binding chemotaxis protein CheW
MGEQQYLTFFAAGEEYGIGILRVREIIPVPVLTKVPGTPDWIRGVVNLRGSVVPVIDLACKFGVGKSEITARSCVVISELKVGEELVQVGVMADAVHQVIDPGSGEVQPPPSFGPRVRVDQIQGMVLIDSKFVLLLDVDRVLTWSEMDSVAAVAVSDSVAVGEATTASAAGTVP